MNPFALVFAPGGRIARLPYFLCGFAPMTVFAIVMGVLLVTLFASVWPVQSQHGQPAIITLFFIVSVAVALGGYIYAIVNLMVKRLHDMGMSGFHVVWIMALNFVTSWFNYMDSPTGAVIHGIGILASFGIALWLLFTPGEPHVNDYGSIFE